MKLAVFSRAIGLLSAFAICLIGAPRHSFSIDVSLAEPIAQNQDSRMVNVTVKNISSEPLSVAVSGAFFDYSLDLSDAIGRPVPFTKEGHAVRFGGQGFILPNGAMMARLQAGESNKEVLDLRRYFDIKSPGKYKLQATRKFLKPEDAVSSNILLIDMKSLVSKTGKELN